MDRLRKLFEDVGARGRRDGDRERQRALLLALEERESAGGEARETAWRTPSATRSRRSSGRRRSCGRGRAPAVREHEADSQCSTSGFFRETPAAAASARCATARTAVDDFRVVGREVYWLCRKSFSQSVFSGARLEKDSRRRDDSAEHHDRAAHRGEARGLRRWQRAAAARPKVTPAVASDAAALAELHNAVAEPPDARARARALVALRDRAGRPLGPADLARLRGPRARKDRGDVHAVDPEALGDRRLVFHAGREAPLSPGPRGRSARAGPRARPKDDRRRDRGGEEPGRRTRSGSTPTTPRRARDRSTPRAASGSAGG